MFKIKLAILATTALTVSPGATFADAYLFEAIQKKQGAILSAKMDKDAFGHEYNITVGSYGVVDTSLGGHDADYEAILAKRDVLIGAALYGAYDGDYDAYLTPPNFFATAALGRYDGDYEAVLSDRGQLVGAAIFGEYDGDYDSYLTPPNFFATAALGQYDADYEIVLQQRAPLGTEFFNNTSDFAALK